MLPRWEAALLILIAAVHLGVVRAAVLPGRGLLQAQAGEIRIVSANASGVVGAFDNVTTGGRIVLDVERVAISGVLTIAAPNVSVVGNSSRGNGTVIVCVSGGAGIEIRATGAVLSNFSIQNCTSTAIRVVKPAGNGTTQLDATIRDVRFFNNDDRNSSGFGQSGGGGLGVVGANVTVEDCIFANNGRNIGGGISAFDSNLTVLRSQFVENSARLTGGAISIESSQAAQQLVVEGCNFTRNRDPESQGPLPGGVSVFSPDSRPLEVSNFIVFSGPGKSGGGAIFAERLQSVQISDSKFVSNFASPAGGALTLLDNNQVNVSKCAFENNEAREGAQDTQGLAQGGAIYLAAPQDDGVSLFLNNAFVNNTAGYGGALHTITAAKAALRVEVCNLTGNVAWLGGGAGVFRNTESMEFVQLNVTANRAKVGGGLILANGAGVFAVTNMTFTNNLALDGGALLLVGSGQANFQRSLFSQNKARGNGGAVAAVQSLASGTVSFLNAEFVSNLAKFGGAIHVDSTARFRLNGATDDQTTFVNNTALGGGAIYVQLRHPVGSSFALSRGEFRSNRALTSPEDVGFLEVKVPRRDSDPDEPAEDVSDLLGSIDPEADNPCTPGGGGAICLALTRIAERVTITVDIEESNFIENSASTGGAVFIGTTREAQWSAPKTCGSALGDSVTFTAAPCRELGIQDLHFENNTAENGGNNLFATDPDDVWSAEKGRLSKFSQLSASATGQNSTSGENLMGSVASAVTRLDVSSATLEDAYLVRDHLAGIPLPTVNVTLRDAFDQVILGGITDSGLVVTVTGDCKDGGDCVTGQRTVTARDGIASFDGINIVAQPGDYSLSFSAIGVPPVVANFTIRDCRPGEVNSTTGGLNVCQNCSAGEYSFIPQVDCRKCESRAICSGMAALVPNDGYWHSSPFSIQLHQCLFEDACKFEILTPDGTGNTTTRREILTEFYSNLELKEVEAAREEMYNNAEYQQCRQGYQGVLCASCESGYGHLPGGECSKCDENRKVTVVYILLIFLWSLVLLALAVRSALSSIKNIAEAHEWSRVSFKKRPAVNVNSNGAGCKDPSTMPCPEAMDALSNGGSKSEIAPEGSSSERNCADPTKESGKPRRSIVSSITAQRPALPAGLSEPAPGSQQVSIDHITAAEKISETLKIATNFLQVTGVAVSINVDWTATVKKLLGVWDTLVAFSNSSSLFAMDCALSEDSAVARPIRGTIFRVFFPFLLFVVVSVFFFLMHVHNRRKGIDDPGYLSSRITISALALVFFSYHSITEELMRTLNCVSLDDPTSEEPAYSDFAVARGRFWAEDTSEQCFESHHGLLAFALGVPGLALFSLGAPVVLLTLLLRSRAQGRLTDNQFLNSYGFVYQNYTESHVYWEVIILVRKALIGAVVVFGYEAGSNLQGVMALGILIVALVMHTVCLPYKYDALNLVEGLSLLVSILTFYSGVVFNDENTSTAARHLFTGVVLLANLVVVGCFLFMLFRYLDVFVTARLWREGIQPPGSMPWRLARFAGHVLGRTVLVQRVGASLAWLACGGGRRKRQQAELPMANLPYRV
ncbi:unnamed protein product [Ostreobium quekettii]|uniref:TRP C-terminal domain-containing protein n=1 Tax=Ostreobium quekettii TaxID=121088 RepID=A0A8S1IPT1_9CHLO|nr:unnamed protein product [Ostreobium quekettii]|eukprot:evm.model.scf_180.1 EVM.evm.TU.scf_180.1   scf_180:2487-16253(+)